MKSHRPERGNQPTRLESAAAEAAGPAASEAEREAEESRPVPGSPPASAVSERPADRAARGAGAALEDSLLVGKSLGNYVIDRRLARGGMAVVYVARHPTRGCEVAVKLLNDEYRHDRDLNRRFLQEARVMSALRHPNVVEILDLGEIEGRAYYAMELLLGMDLAQKLSRVGRLHYRELGPYFSQIASALDAAHARGIVHRDLKPANVFVAGEKPLLLKLMDFGIAKIKQGKRSGRPHRGEVLGTPAYMAPEQVMGNVAQITPATDVYALGVIAYEMLSGRLPFVADSDLELLSMHVRDEPPPLARAAPGLPPEVVEMVERCLKKDPRDRPGSAGELAQALSRSASAAEDEPPLSQAEARARAIDSMPPTEPPPPETDRPRSRVSRR